MERLGNNSVKPCEICMGGSGTEYCLECEHYFCISCKSLHKRQKVSRNHKPSSSQITL
jgi:hypothetical protein